MITVVEMNDNKHNKTNINEAPTELDITESTQDITIKPTKYKLTNTEIETILLQTKDDIIEKVIRYSRGMRLILLSASVLNIV